MRKSVSAGGGGGVVESERVQERDKGDNIRQRAVSARIYERRRKE